MNRRGGFTMIELVFIIVILGILGAIAVPKMAANRENALVVTLKNDMAMILQAVPAYAMAHGAYLSDGKTLMRLSDVTALSPDIWNVAEYIHDADDTSLSQTRNVESLLRNESKGNLGICASLRIVSQPDVQYRKDIKVPGPFLEYWISKDPLCAILRNEPHGTEGADHIIDYIPLSGFPVQD